jgi:hypothetical protein
MGDEHPREPNIRATPFPAGTPAALPVVPAGGDEGLVSVPWRLVRVEDEGRRIVAVYQRRHEYKVIGVHVEELVESVTLSLLAEYRKISGSRTLPRVTVGFSVLLESPLGNRELVDSSNS